MFSVIIPTLQRAPELWPLVEQCAAHPLVLEVLVINNAPEPLSWDSPKVRVLQQEQNIYVNPAWNLGAREAKGEWLAIINDDIRFGDEALNEAARVLRRGWFGVVGPDHPCFEDMAWGKSISHRFAPDFNLVFGTFMCMRREDFRPIPDDLLIWGGDDWLFWSQRKPNAVLVRTRFETDMGATTGSPQFQAMRERERATGLSYAAQWRGTRWWHHAGPAYQRAHRIGMRMRGMLRR